MIEGKHIAVLKGGPGSERKVSLASADSVTKALRERGANVSEVDVQGDDFEIPEGVDIAFNVIHGTFGEDGRLQKVLENKGIPYTGAGSVTSELAFDKILSKERFIANDVPTPAYELFTIGETEQVTMAPPFVMKPPKEGSSVGVHIIKDLAEVEAAVEDIHKYDKLALVESFVKGKELTVGVLGSEALPIVHICPRSGFYDMKNKYPWMSEEGGTDYYCPADLSDEVTAQVQDAALRAHNALGVEVYSRVDLLLDEDERAFVLEVNTIPGMTESSLLPKGAVAAGIDFAALCERIVDMSLKVIR